ncbi:MAG: DNA internalization-related competence protein ComEC/Rec2 [Lachnospiraceae bacterium]|nr:DNA internalization-related competence protein ComEC/Rec2 [Lachnospiraceae bacterium]
MIKRPLAFLACLFLAAAVILMRLHPVRGCLPDIEEGTAVTVRGRLSDRYHKNDSYILVLSDAAPVNGDQGKNKILVYLENDNVSLTELPKTGSSVTVKGEFSLFNSATNPGEFDLREYYHIRGIEYRLFKGHILSCGKKYHVLKEALFIFRLSLSRVYDRLLSDRDSGVLKAMILGDRTGIDPGVKSLYQENGIAHALSISGLHISILGYGLYRLLKRIGVRLKISVSFCVTFIYLYALMTGGSTSTVRAMIMFGVCLFSDIVGRSFDLLSALSLSLMIILFTDPLYIYDAGFMLSFGSVLGIALICPMLREGLPFGNSRILSGAEASLSVTLFTLPVTLYFFYEVPLYSVFLNLLVVPLMGILVVSAILAGVLGLFILILGIPWGFICHIILILYERGCLFFRSLPGAGMVIGRPGSRKIFLYYLLMLILCVTYRKVKKKGKKRMQRMIPVMLLFLPLIFFINTYRGVSYTMLDIGQGDCNVVTGRNKKTVIIDCGSSSEENIGKYRVIPFLKYMGISTVDVMVVTHADRDHISGFEEILDMGEEREVNIKKLIMPGTALKDRESAALAEKAEKAGLEVCYINSGGTLKSGDMEFSCLWPDRGFSAEDRNETSTVLKLETEGFSVLFTGDIQGTGEKGMIGNLRGEKRITVLKTAHHGSKNSTPEEFLELVKPEYALISAGRNNRYSHPHKELLKRLEEAGSEIHLTAREGAVTVTAGENTVSVTGFVKSSQ